MKIILRADGNSNIGLGHFFRVLALAEILEGKFDYYIAISNPNDFIKEQVTSVGAKIIDLIENPAEDYLDLHDYLKKGDIVVIDSYIFGNSYQKKIKDRGCIVIHIDDTFEEYPHADGIINHGIAATPDRYKNTLAKIFSGPDYAMLRKSFLQEARKKKVKNKFDTVFMCFGGADLQGLTYQYSDFIIKDIKQIKNIHILLSSSYKGNLEKFSVLSGSATITIHQNLDSAQIIHLMNSCDFALISSSNIAYECASTDLPMIIGYYTDHQRDFYGAIIKQSNVIGINYLQNVTAEILSAAINELIKQYDDDSPRLIDGLQGDRFISLFKSFTQKTTVLKA